MHGNYQTGCEVVTAEGPGRSSPSSGGGGAGTGDGTSGGGPDVRCEPNVHSQLAASGGVRGPLCVEGPQAWSQGRAGVGRASSGDGGPADRGPLPGPVAAAVRVVDAGSGGGVDPTAVWHRVVGLDRGAVSSALGFHAAEAGASGLRAGPGGGPAVAGPGVSGD